MYGLIKLAELHPREQLPPILGGATRRTSSRPLSQLEQMTKDEEWKPGPTLEDLAGNTTDATTGQKPKPVSILNMSSEELDEYRKEQQLLFENEYGNPRPSSPSGQSIEHAPKGLVSGADSVPPLASPIQHSQVDLPESKLKSALRESEGVMHRHPARTAIGFGLAGAGLAGLGIAAHQRYGKGE